MCQNWFIGHCNPYFLLHETKGLQGEIRTSALPISEILGTTLNRGRIMRVRIS